MSETNRIRSRNCPCIRCGHSPVQRRPGRSAPNTCRLPHPGSQGGRMFQNSDELLKYIKDEGVEMVDVRFVDLPGIEQHFTVPVSSFDQSVLHDRLAFHAYYLPGSHELDVS